MKTTRTVVAAALIASAAACSSNDISPGAGQTAPDSPRVNGARVVYTSAADKDVWLEEIGTGARKRLTSNGEARTEYEPRFAGESSVSYFVDNSIEIVNIESGKTTTLVAQTSTEADVHAGSRSHDWSPDGKLAYLAVAGLDESGNVRFDLVIADRSGKTLSRTRLPILRLEGIGGRCSEPTLVRFSPGGRLLAVEVTVGTDGKESKNSVVFLDAAGKLVGTTWGVHRVRFIDDSRAVGLQGMEWVTIEPAARTTSRMTLPQGTSIVEPSADGKSAAIEVTSDRGEQRVSSVSIVDLASGRSRPAADGAARPLWLTGDQLLVLTGEDAWCSEVASVPATVTEGRTTPLGSGLVNEIDVLST